MIERDLNDSFPENSLTSRNCQNCGTQHQVAGLMDIVSCPACQDGLIDCMDSGWFDALDPVERKAG
ncbi:MAG: hypothetical protein ACHQZQ_04940 [SAR324 cluster bacterium]